MPRKPKSLEELNPMENPVPEEPEKQEEIEQSTKKRTRRKKAVEELESFEGEPATSTVQEQVQRDEAEMKDEIERSIKRRPRRTKISEEAIEKAKAEIIEKINAGEQSEPSAPEEAVQEKKSRVRAATKKSLEPYTASERLASDIIEKNIWEKKWESKIQQPKPVKKEGKAPWWQVWKKDWFRKSSTVAKLMSLPTIAAAGGLSDTANKAADTLGKETEYAVTRNFEAKKAPRITEIKEIPDHKAFGDITLLGRLLVPYHNDDYEVCIAYFDGKENDQKAMEKMINAMHSEGYEPGDGKLLMEIVKENPALSKRAPYILAPVPFMDKNDQVTQEVINVRTEQYAPKDAQSGTAEEFQDHGTVAQKKFTSTDTTQKIKTIIEVLNAGHAAFPTVVKGKPTRFEEDQGIVYGEHGYVFLKKITARLKEDLAKK